MIRLNLLLLLFASYSSMITQRVYYVKFLLVSVIAVFSRLTTTVCLLSIVVVFLLSCSRFLCNINFFHSFVNRGFVKTCESVVSL